jgi:hypothetical protein
MRGWEGGHSKKRLKKFKKKVQKKVQKKGRIKVWQKGSNDSIAEYCIIAEVQKKFEKSSKKKFKKKFENITNCWRGEREEGREGGELSFQCLMAAGKTPIVKIVKIPNLALKRSFPPLCIWALIKVTALRIVLLGKKWELILIHILYQ